MSEIALARINSFASAEPQNGFVSPSEEPVFVLTRSQLQEIITEAIQEATEGQKEILDRLHYQEGENKALNAKLEALQKDQNALAENDLNQLRLINELKQKPEEKSPLLDELYKEMKAQGRKQTDFATAARMIKRSKGRLLQLKVTIALDQRFILIPSEGHSQKLLIRLREFYKTA
jgi:predicted nuclease with TOPRIM domain